MKSLMILFITCLCLLTGSAFCTANAASTICGDADGSGKINLLDVSYIINYLYRSGPKPDPMKSADVDNSNKINLLDVSYIISNLYRGGPKPICSNYLGLIPPDSTPIVFAPEVVSSSGIMDHSGVFDPLLKEFYFMRYGGTYPTTTILYSKFVSGSWTSFAPAPFSGSNWDNEPFISPDGNKLFFSSDRACPSCQGYVWYMDKTESGWSEPVHLDAPLGGAGIMYPTVSLNGNMYFTKNDVTPWELYVSKFIDGEYQTPEKLGSAINKGYAEAYSYIAPDEGYIIFSAENRPGGYGARDLYISFRKDDGSWTESLNLGNKINSTYNDFMPNVTPDGKYFLFTRPITDDDIYWCDTKFIDKMRLGIRKIAFITYRYGGVNEIATINEDGTGYQRLTNNLYNDDTPAFSPDGEEIAYAFRPDGGANQFIYIMNYDGTNVRQLTNMNGRDYFPDWSPDGTKIAFSRYDIYDTKGRIFVIDIATGIETQLTFGSGAYEDNTPDWFSDGDSLLFTSWRTGVYQQFIMNADGSNQHNISNTSTETYGGKLSPDGTKIAYDLITSWSPFRDEIHIMNSDGTGDVVLAADGNIDERADWSPDGTELAFQSDRNVGYFRLYRMNADGSNVRLISATSNRDYWPSWGIIGAAPSVNK